MRWAESRIQETARLTDTLFEGQPRTMPKNSTESLIKPQSKDEKERITIAISTERAKELKTYAKFLNDSEVSYVVDQALAYLFSRDRAYQSFVKGAAPAAVVEAAEPTKSGRKKAGDTPGATAA